MINKTSFKADIKTIIRDPILIIFFVLPIFISIVFKYAVQYSTPILYDYYSFDLTKYYGYVLSLGILMTPWTLGTVAGFLMIDERDSRIQELIKITPIGFMGYITNRLILPFIGSFIYTMATYKILNIYYVESGILLLICILTGLQGMFIGYLLYILAKDKVQGLTYSKGLVIFNILALADILNTRWFSIIAALTPFYWLTRIIVNFSLNGVLVAIVSHIIYLVVILRMK